MSQLSQVETDTSDEKIIFWSYIPSIKSKIRIFQVKPHVRRSLALAGCKTRWLQLSIHLYQRGVSKCQLLLFTVPQARLTISLWKPVGHGRYVRGQKVGESIQVADFDPQEDEGVDK